jgi:hypothetical protein
MFNTFSRENKMIDQNIVRFTKTVVLRVDSKITLDTGDYPLSAQDGIEIQRDLDDLLKYVRLAVKARPGTLYREALEDRAWRCYQHLHGWGSLSFE